MIKVRTILVIIITLILAIIAYLFASHKPAVAPDKLSTDQSALPSPTPADFRGKEEILKNALNLYAQKKQERIDFSNGPCLGEIAPDWVADIAHNPRQAVDDKPENQCADFREGRAHHFVELDPNGNLITAN
ncbi:hypothetical protein A2696_01705 [Candidatus Curtissbacteria bacterium RIFCSPHIGHO2_01_FULL_41_13]|uniref:Uncharacterized protein n=1 Tax=Candidatus Curtissbacteria bacterium RIFCSPHIGHO2_01_FULL_41_13 TaxID=1797745 RepID=A0A1F5G013_9BACT|nr:MAG: hypothetical protein A2696_01705 [Candidatus Curtissbacteria bacterium RIFCSPHIGHO2_01_FULL_41_13]